MSMHPSVENALEEIDAAVFSGDTFVREENRTILEEYMGRWARAMTSFAADEAENDT
ncbi:hypothetical protein DSS3P8_103 [Roseobacter phage DSS3P8]|nr:hypothetical protein DSS3P8_103 [Roseobacter phage DSS3P8]